MPTQASHADILPPWIKSLDEIDMATATAEEHWAFANWYLDRQDDPEIWSTQGYLRMQPIIYDLAYPYLNPNNDNRDMAIAQANLDETSCGCLELLWHERQEWLRQNVRKRERELEKA